MTECPLADFLLKPRYNAENILKNYELFIYEVIYFISFRTCRNRPPQWARASSSRGF